MTEPKALNPRQGLVLLSILCAIFLLALIFLPGGPHNRRAAHEAASASRLSSILGLQVDYLVAHPEKGFACELRKLRKSEQVKDSEYDSQEFLVSGVHSGYRFAIVNCRPGPAGTVEHYDVIAVPVEPGKSGVRAFCSNESGKLWYDDEGSPTDCLASRRVIE